MPVNTYTACMRVHNCVSMYCMYCLVAMYIYLLVYLLAAQTAGPLLKVGLPVFSVSVFMYFYVCIN